jgi:hypothetical protein
MLEPTKRVGRRKEGLRYVVISCVGMLLGFGLCNAGPHTSSETPIFIGSLLFLVSPILFLVGLVKAIGGDR